MLLDCNCNQLSVREIYLSLTNHPGQLSLAIPPWVGTISDRAKGGDALWLGVKAGMARVWWQVKLCEFLYNTCHI